MYPSGVVVWFHRHCRHSGWKFVLFPKLQNDHVDYKTSLKPTFRVFELSISDPQQTPTHWLQLSDIRGTAHYCLTRYRWRSESQKRTQLLLQRVMVTQLGATPWGPSSRPLSARTIHLQTLCRAAFVQFSRCYLKLYLRCFVIPPYFSQSNYDINIIASLFQWATFGGSAIWKSKAEWASLSVWGSYLFFFRFQVAYFQKHIDNLFSNFISLHPAWMEQLCLRSLAIW